MPENSKILVTGGGGYIGSHTCKALADCGYMPIAFDNLSTGHRDFVKWGPLEVGDIRDYFRLEEVIKKYRPNAAIHFAASAYVGESVSNPLKYYENNIFGSTVLIKALTSNNINQLVFSSSCATYGIPKVDKINEDCEQKPINPYGFSKFAVEQCLRDVAVSSNLRFVSLRYFNAAGADSDGEIGEKHDPETHLIPLAIKSAMGMGKLKVYGTDFDTPDGSAVRDYTHVSDLASAHLLALQYLEGHGKSTAVNLGTGKGTSVLQVINGVKKIFGNIEYEVDGRREGDPAYLVADSDLAKNLLGWTPKYQSIESILMDAVNWHKKNGF